MENRCGYTVRCPMRRTLNILNGKWKAIILFCLREKPRRFGELRKFIPEATAKVLTQQLRELEEDGIIDRKVIPEIPPKVEYFFTDYGRTLEPVLDQMARWGWENIQSEAVSRG